jgi:4-hydroxybenzoate polyprenyltransferase
VQEWSQIVTIAAEQMQGASRPAAYARLVALRLPDLLVLQGPPLLGVAFVQKPFTSEGIVPLLLLLLANSLLLAYVFLLNDSEGLAADSSDPNKARETAVAMAIGWHEMRLLSIILGCLGLLLFGLISLGVLLPAVCIAVLALIYSSRAVHAKGIPILSSGVHLAGGVLLFLLGYALFGEVDRRGLLIGLYFALIFAAGHLNQEVRDYEADLRSGIVTNAVRFGKRHTFLAAFLVFTCSYVYLLWLGSLDILPARVGWILGLYPVHAVLFWRTYRGDLTFERVSRFRAYYRVLYALVGVMLVAIVWSSAPPVPPRPQ